MKNIAIDPYILAYPNETNTSIDEFEDYINRLLELNQLQDEMNLNYVISGNTAALLTITNNYPDWATLKVELSRYGLDGIYQPKDIFATLDKLLKNQCIEEISNTEEILYENVYISPNELIENRPINYTDELFRLLMYMCLEIKKGNDYFLASIETIDSIVTIQGDIYDIESKANLPKHYKEKFSTFSTIKQFLCIVDPILIWKNAQEELDYINAININLFQRTGEITGKKNWYFGKKFLKTVSDLGFLSDDSKIKSLLKSITDTIINVNLSATHSLRSGEGGTSPQLTRMSDKAWRRDVDYEFHLHYWVKDNSFEFAALVTHNDMHIPR